MATKEGTFAANERLNSDSQTESNERDLESELRGPRPLKRSTEQNATRQKLSGLKVSLSFAGVFVLQNVLMSAQPHIELIERFGTNQITIHFGTDANRTYELQYLLRLSSSTNTAGTNSGAGPGVWSNLFVVPAIPFPNHYVIADTMTNQQRLYRLRVTP